MNIRKNKKSRVSLNVSISVKMLKQMKNEKFVRKKVPKDSIPNAHPKSF